MMSDQTTNTYNDELDLMELAQTVWEGKWIITLITCASLALGGLYLFLAPIKYEAQLKIAKPSDAFIEKFTTLNELLVRGGYKNVISAETLFDQFKSEFEDYEEIVEVIKSNSSKFAEFDGTDEEKDKLAILLAKQFEISPPSKTETEWHIKFEWYDEAEGLKILERSLSLILLNQKASSIDRLIQLKLNLENRYQLEKAQIEKQLSAISDKIYLELEKRLLFLDEQAAIAHELGLEKNSLDASALTQTRGVAVSVQSSDVPFYLRGYKAIEKEANLIRKRTEAQHYALNSDY